MISTLQGLLDTGDNVQVIEGVFSGTLSYIFNQVSKEMPFSQVVTKAKELGFTEPDPRDDLAGDAHSQLSEPDGRVQVWMSREKWLFWLVSAEWTLNWKNSQSRA